MTSGHLSQRMCLAQEAGLVDAARPEQLKPMLATFGVNTRGWRRLLGLGDALFLPQVAPPGGLQSMSGSPAFAVVCELLVLIQRCEMDAPPELTAV